MKDITRRDGTRAGFSPHTRVGITRSKQSHERIESLLK
jgi:hypothetical protein